MVNNCYKLDNNVLEHYVEQEFGDKLTIYGFQRYRGCGRRWHKIANDIIYSVQYVRNHELIEVYYGYQPSFIPFEFIDTRMRLRSKNWTFFDAEVQYAQQYGIPSGYHSYPFNLLEDVKFFHKLMELTVFSTFREVVDLDSCHEMYKKQRLTKDWWDPRWMFECIALGYYTECERILKEILPKIDESAGPLPLSDVWNEPHMQQSIISRILKSKDYTPFVEQMNRTRGNNMKRMKRAGYL